MKKRWLRWLGAMFRTDRKTWIVLLDGDYKRWANAVLQRTDEEDMTGHDDLKAYYRLAIERATEGELRKLDMLYIAYNAKS